MTDNRGVDVVLEMIGGDVYQKSLQALAPGGRLVSIGGAFGAIPDTPPTLTENRKATRFSITNYLKAKPEDFKELDEVLKLGRRKEISSHHRQEFSVGGNPRGAALSRRSRSFRQSHADDLENPGVMEYWNNGVFRGISILTSMTQGESEPWHSKSHASAISCSK